MAHPHFYRVKAALLQWQIAQASLKEAFDRAKTVFENELQASGLDPAKAYRLDDDQQDIVEASDERATES